MSLSKADIDKIGASGDQDRKTIGAQTEADVTKMGKSQMSWKKLRKLIVSKLVRVHLQESF